MGNPISFLRDDFADNQLASAWSIFLSGSAAVAETGGQASIVLPSSTAGAHQAGYRSNALYDLTGDQFVWNIGTMVATGVAAFAYFQLLLDATAVNSVYWRQTANAITARKIVAGVDTQLFTATWSATTYKYLRIRESGGTIFFDSSTDGISWTNRASIVGLPFVVTDMLVQFAASCGNVASPGSLKLDDVNLLIGVASTWRWTQVEWSLSNRFRPITIACEAGKQGYIAVASTIDSSGNLVSPAYYSGPIGSVSGGYNALTLAASQSAAQAMAVDLPLNGRWDLPAIVEARFIRLYHRSTDGASHKLFEYYPRRIVQTDDIEAESIRAINIGAGQVTADKIFVLTLGAITANIGQLNIDTTGYLYQGTGTADAPTTGLKIFNSGGIGKLSTYNAGVEQVTFDTDGILKAGAGTVQLSAVGIEVVASTSYLANRSYGFSDGTNRVADIFGIEGASQHSLDVSLASKAARDSVLHVIADAPTGKIAQIQLITRVNGTGGAQITLANGGGSPGVSVVSADFAVLNGGIHAGSATGATSGQISTSGSVGLGGAVLSNARLLIKGVDATSSNYALSVQDSAGTLLFIIRNDGATGFFGSAGGARPTVTGSRAGNAALASFLTAMAGLGLITNSSTV